MCCASIVVPICQKGTAINYVVKQIGRGLPKCQRFYTSLCSKFVNEWGGQIFSKSRQRSQWMSLNGVAHIKGDSMHIAPKIVTV